MAKCKKFNPKISGRKNDGIQSFLNRPRYQPRIPPCCNGRKLETYPEDDDGTFRTGGANAAAEKVGADWRYYLHERAFFHSIGMHDDEYIAERLGVNFDTFSQQLTRLGLTTNTGRREYHERGAA